MGEHRIGIEQTYRFSPTWEIRCTCGWTHPYNETVKRDVIDKHLAATATEPRRSVAGDGGSAGEG